MPESDRIAFGQSMSRHLAHKVRLYRERVRGITQEQAADELGISRAYVTKIESGKDKPGRNLLTRLAAWMGVSVDYLLSDTPAPDGEDFSDQVQKQSLLKIWD